jgi:hypothetical protein
MVLVTLLYNTSQIFDANEQTTNGRNKTHIQAARLASQIANPAKINPSCQHVRLTPLQRATKHQTRQNNRES